MKLVLTFSLLLIGVVTIEYYITRHRINTGVDLANSTRPFQQQGGDLRMLIIGDSTVVGTGASAPAFSIAGLVGQTFPQATIVNKGVNGAKTHDLVERLGAMEGEFDVVMIHVGGNDVVRFTDYGELENSIARVLHSAKGLGSNVTLTMSGNLGTAQLLPFGTRWIFEKRTRKIREIFKAAAEENGVVYNDLFREKDRDPFAQDPRTFYAADLFHPSDAGYADWYHIIEPGIKKALGIGSSDTLQ